MSNIHFVNYDKFCNDVLDIDHSIRFAAIGNRNGELIGSGTRQDIQSLLDPQEVKMSIYHAYLRNETRKNLAHRIGKEKYSMTEYEKIKRITIPVEKDHLLLVSTELNVDHTKIVNDIFKLIANTPLA